jgi:hypothetical protein
MSISELTKSVRDFFSQVLKQNCRVLSVMPYENSWKATCELTVDPDYTTRKGMGDIVEVYEVFIDDHLNVSGFTLKETKRKATLDNE